MNKVKGFLRVLWGIVIFCVELAAYTIGIWLFSDLYRESPDPATAIVLFLTLALTFCLVRRITNKTQSLLGKRGVLEKLDPAGASLIAVIHALGTALRKLKGGNSQWKRNLREAVAFAKTSKVRAVCSFVQELHNELLGK
ncbi:hypothetical protein KKB83_04865 [Patescibacteria group bacterium]|nr:hypothetical protein [Patescibacteria group bacterium]